MSQAIVQLPHLGNMLRELDAQAVAAEESGVDVPAQIQEQILAADTFEDLFRAQNAGTVAGKDYAGRPFLLRPQFVEWRRGRQSYIDAGGFPFYFFARVIDLESGEEIVLNSGGKTIVAMMYKLTTTPKYWTGFEEGRAFVLKSNAAAESDYEFLTIHPYAMPQPAGKGGKR